MRFPQKTQRLWKERERGFVGAAKFGCALHSETKLLMSRRLLFLRFSSWLSILTPYFHALSKNRLYSSNHSIWLHELEVHLAVEKVNSFLTALTVLCVTNSFPNFLAGIKMHYCFIKNTLVKLTTHPLQTRVALMHCTDFFSTCLAIIIQDLEPF